jgi:hypothetical protein
VFNSEDVELGDFSLCVPEFPQMGCSCETKEKKKFKESSTFLCVGADSDNISEAEILLVSTACLLALV